MRVRFSRESETPPKSHDFGYIWCAMSMQTLRPIPAAAAQLCEALHAPPQLVRHLTLVHNAAAELLDGLAAAFPSQVIDREAVLFGAATHDLGKVLHPNELRAWGSRHEDDGPALLEQHGVPKLWARFARTHGQWQEAGELEDLIVALADQIWCGRRRPDLEERTAKFLAKANNLAEWIAWSKLDGLLDTIGDQSWHNVV